MKHRADTWRLGVQTPCVWAHRHPEQNTVILNEVKDDTLEA
jgi:hypothetical protein